ncbi:MAG: lysophospholipid acyltransferase family protein [Bacteroidota bacterium]
MSRFLYQFFFSLAGWKIEGRMPGEKKFIIIVAPHTSNWDFMIGLCARSILRFDAKFLGKKELFRFPFGTLFRWLGGVPVDRSKHTNFVDAVADIFNQHDKFILAIAPEGTRKYVAQWKTGFYHMAVKANVPIVMTAFDYSRKTIFIREPFYPTGNFASDMKTIFNFYGDKKGKFPKELPSLN